MLLRSLCLVLCGAAATAARRSYDGHTVLRVTPTTLNASKALIDQLEGLQVSGHDLDVFKIWEHRDLAGSIDVRVSPAERARIVGMGHPFTVMNDDLGSAVRATYQKILTKPNSTEPADFFDNFADLDELLGYYKDLATTYPSMVEWVPSIGKSWEGRDIPAVHIKGNNYRGSKKFYFEGQIHAREWVSGITVAYVATQLLKGYASDPSILDELEFVIVPVVNPDGFVYTWTTDRLWRKNRRDPPSGSSCMGVDLNRNWDSHWSGPGASDNPCSDTYYGSSAFSEPETKATSDYILKTGPFLVGIDYHSFSQIVMRPYGWTLPGNKGGQDPPSKEALQAAAEGMADAIKRTHGQLYTPEPAAQLYVASGGADDWMFDDGKCNKAFTFELRDLGRYGFVLPASEIKPNGEEIWEAVQWLIKSELGAATA